MQMQPFIEKDIFIQRCVELSENVSQYIGNKLYLLDVDDLTQIDQLFLKTQCLDLIFSDLAGRGIVLVDTTQDFLEQINDTEIPLQLHARFSSDRFFELIKNFSDESKQRLMVEFEYDDEQLCARICDVLSSILPVDAAWQYLAENAHLFVSNNTFRDNMHPLVEKAIFQASSPAPIESDLNRISAWMAGEQKHQYELRKLLVLLAEEIYSRQNDNESATPLKLALLKKMDRYDWDHFNNDFIEKFTIDPSYESKQEPYHQQHNDHHIQYYFQHKGITDVQIIYVAGTAASKEAGNTLREILKTDSPQITPEDKQKMLDVLLVAEEIWVKNFKQQNGEVTNGGTV